MRIGEQVLATKGAGVTGITETADGQALFINIQHTGDFSKPLASEEAPQIVWPGNQGHGVKGRPCSATIVITRQDAGLIGL